MLIQADGCQGPGKERGQGPAVYRMALGLSDLLGAVS